MNEARAMELWDRIESDPQARERFSHDPVGVFELSGIELTSEDRQMLQSVQGLAGEELSQRVSKLW
jgi:hypothetical protein